MLIMDYHVLVEEITRLVLLELEKNSKKSISDPGKSITRILVLIDPEMSSFDELFKTLQNTSEINPDFQLVVTDTAAEKIKASSYTLRYNLIINPDRSSFRKLAQSTNHVIIPHLSVTTLSKMANLIGDEPVPGIFIETLLSGTQVTVCSDYIHSLNFSDTPPSKKLLSIIRANMTTLEELGVGFAQLKGIGKKIAERRNVQSTLPPGAKNVVTNEDVLVAVNQKLKKLNFPRGTIITPLARETAKTLGIEINLV